MISWFNIAPTKGMQWTCQRTFLR